MIVGSTEAFFPVRLVSNEALFSSFPVNSAPLNQFLGPPSKFSREGSSTKVSFQWWEYYRNYFSSEVSSSEVLPVRSVSLRGIYQGRSVPLKCSQWQKFPLKCFQCLSAPLKCFPGDCQFHWRVFQVIICTTEVCPVRLAPLTCSLFWVRIVPLSFFPSEVSSTKYFQLGQFLWGVFLVCSSTLKRFFTMIVNSTEVFFQGLSVPLKYVQWGQFHWGVPFSIEDSSTENFSSIVSSTEAFIQWLSVPLICFQWGSSTKNRISNSVSSIPVMFSFSNEVSSTEAFLPLILALLRYFQCTMRSFSREVTSTSSEITSTEVSEVLGFPLSSEVSYTEMLSSEIYSTENFPMRPVPWWSFQWSQSHWHFLVSLFTEVLFQLRSVPLRFFSELSSKEVCMQWSQIRWTLKFSQQGRQSAESLLA